MVIAFGYGHLSSITLFAKVVIHFGPKNMIKNTMEGKRDAKVIISINTYTLICCVRQGNNFLVPVFKTSTL
jgi:hypothetical protein